jgi:hypothetical protein
MSRVGTAHCEEIQHDIDKNKPHSLSIYQSDNNYFTKFISDEKFCEFPRSVIDAEIVFIFSVLYLISNNNMG